LEPCAERFSEKAFSQASLALAHCWYGASG
jgi:hypothetical protein